MNLRNSVIILFATRNFAAKVRLMFSRLVVSSFTRIFCLALLLTLGAVDAYAQVQPNIDSGVHAFGSYHGGYVETVSLSNGNVLFRIPLVSYPQRGGKLGVEYFIVDNAKKWQVALRETAASGGGVNTTYYWTATNVNTGDSLGVSSSLTVQVRRTRTVSNDPVSGILIEGDLNYRVVTPDGGTHLLSGPLDNAGTIFKSYDTSGFQFTLTLGQRPDHRDDTGVLVDRNGTHYFYTVLSTWIGTTVSDSIFLVGHNKGEGSEPRTVTTYKDVGLPSKIVDANGNTMVYGNGTPTVDTVGRTLGSASPFPMPVATSDFSHCSIPNHSISGAVIYNFAGPNGQNTPVKACSANSTIATAFSQANVIQYPNQWGDAQMGLGPSSIVLPDGSSWSLDFDVYGNITTLIYPTGGSVSYEWQEVSNLNSCSEGTNVSRAVRTRTVTDGSGRQAVWRYSWGQPQSDGSITNIVTDPNGNERAHVMRPQAAPCAYYETQTRTYQGSAVGGKLLKTVDTVYTGVQGVADSGRC